MVLIPDVSTNSINSDDPAQQVESLVKQINDAFRQLSNESLTKLYKDNSGTNRIIIGVLPDGETGIVMSKEDVDVTDVFN